MLGLVLGQLKFSKALTQILDLSNVKPDDVHLTTEKLTCLVLNVIVVKTLWYFCLALWWCQILQNERQVAAFSQIPISRTKLLALCRNHMEMSLA